MKFWDSSAIVPLLVQEETSEQMRRVVIEDEDMLVWWGTPVECTSAISRRERDGDLDPQTTSIALERLRTLAPNWSEIQPSDRLRTLAQRSLRVHALRAADSLQLAAALVGAGNDPASLDMVCLDHRLVLAAQREGFRVIF